MPEERHRSAVLAQPERLQQRADPGKKNGRGVLLERQVLNPGEHKPVFAKGKVVAFLSSVRHSEPQIGSNPERSREVASLAPPFWETGDGQGPGRPDGFKMFGAVDAFSDADDLADTKHVLLKSLQLQLVALTRGHRFGKRLPLPTNTQNSST